MKRFLRYICLAMAVVLLLAVPARAEEASTWASSFFGSYDASIYKVSYRNIEAWFDVVAVEGMDELGVTSIKIQRSPDGSEWTTMKTYTPDKYPEMLCEDTSFHAGYVTYVGTPGYYYRAYMTFYAKNSTGTGKRFVYSNVIQL